MEKWGHDRILSDVVWVIRRYRPDVVILVFSGTPADGHGQHQVSAILGKEAFSAAADAKQFPDQLKYVQPWQAKRLVRASFGAGRGGPPGGPATPGAAALLAPPEPPAAATPTAGGRGDGAPSGRRTRRRTRCAGRSIADAGEANTGEFNPILDIPTRNWRI